MQTFFQVSSESIKEVSAETDFTKNWSSFYNYLFIAENITKQSPAAINLKFSLFMTKFVIQRKDRVLQHLILLNTPSQWF